MDSPCWDSCFAFTRVGSGGGTAFLLSYERTIRTLRQVFFGKSGLGICGSFALWSSALFCGALCYNDYSLRPIMPLAKNSP